MNHSRAIVIAALLALGLQVGLVGTAFGAEPTPPPAQVPGQLWPIYGPQVPAPDPPMDGPSVPPGANPELPPVRDQLDPAATPAPGIAHRKFNFSVHLTPFSGFIALADPRSGMAFTPMMARLGIGISIVVGLAEMFDLECSLAGDISFGTSTLDQVSRVFEDGVRSFDSGTATIGSISPSVLVLADWVGLGFVYDRRWDTITITSIGAPAESFSASGGALGLRLLAGLGLRSPELRLVWELSYFFREARGGAPALSTSLRFDAGVVALTLSFQSLYSISHFNVPYARRIATLGIGFQTTF